MNVRTKVSGWVCRNWALAALTAGALALLPSVASAQGFGDGPPKRLIMTLRAPNGVTGSSARTLLRSRMQRALDRVAQRRGVGLRRLRALALARTELVSVDRNMGLSELEALAAELASDPNVEAVEVDRMLQPVFTPNDPSYSSMWHYFESTGGVRLPTAWDSTDGAGAVVAVIDTGYRPHADLVGNLLPGYDMISDSVVGNDGDGRDSSALDPGDWVNAGECGFGQPSQFQSSSWHGTHVAGTVAAVGDNGVGITGVAFGAQVVPIRALGKCGGYTSDIADSIIWASGGSVSGVPANPNPADVINLSLGGGGSCSPVTQSAINVARGNGSTVVVAAGNSNANASNYTPASCNGVISVAATNRDGGRSYYSNFGSVVDVAAPGGDIRASSTNGVLSTLNSGTTGPGSDTYEYYQGTSMAAPHIAGIAALLYSVDATVTPTEVEDAIVSTARSFPASCSGCGSGIADATAAIAAITGGGGPPPPPATELNESNLSGATGSQTFFTLDVPAGASDLSFVMSGGTGDADLYVRFGSPPTTSTYDCRPFRWGNDETCDFANPQAGTYHVMVRGYSSYSGVSLVGTYTDPGSQPTCPAGSEIFTGTLTGTGDYEYHPGGTYYFSNSGSHTGTLIGPAGADFDLKLWQWQGQWVTVAQGTGPTPNEVVTYNGSRAYYVWRIESASGSGDYTFCLERP